MIVNKLDIMSANKFSHVNRLANHFVQQSPMSFLRQWAPGMPKMLRRSQIHLYWNILQLKEAILRVNCVVCGEQSVQLYLPTMERICHPCVHDNHAFWCLPVEQAALIFGLDIPDLVHPQTMYLPQLSKIDFDYTDLGAWVVPIKLALTKALEMYGTREGIKRAVEGKTPIPGARKYANPDDEEFEVENQHDIYRAAKLHSPTPVRMRLLVSLGNYHRTAHHHEVSCRVPVVNRDNTRQTHYSCRGCTAMLTYNKGERISDTNMRLMRLDPELDKYERSFQLFRRAFRVWTKEELIEHIRAECIAGWILLYFEARYQQF
ncbi:hypothetical protein N7519_009023 [Penicillium mononematosum]|uniref:uncharacterized protein n=1 Tax=Penicillium mononematosum TaxID=268346 RepID=UPI00254713AA|nr:uncharacterized protein N7519_009023 [Penicillium mononematosum]KAJ6178562.1 hypothetical protein N7519_009023 [Penicillium mononematosum]